MLTRFAILKLNIHFCSSMHPKMPVKNYMVTVPETAVRTELGKGRRSGWK